MNSTLTRWWRSLRCACVDHRWEFAMRLAPFGNCRTIDANHFRNIRQRFTFCRHASSKQRMLVRMIDRWPALGWRWLGPVNRAFSAWHAGTVDRSRDRRHHDQRRVAVPATLHPAPRVRCPTQAARPLGFAGSGAPHLASPTSPASKQSTASVSQSPRDSETSQQADAPGSACEFQVAPHFCECDGCVPARRRWKSQA